jgi:hypothetical protein
VRPCSASYLGATINGTIAKIPFLPRYDVRPALGITLLMNRSRSSVGAGWHCRCSSAALGEPQYGCNLGLLASTGIPLQRTPQSASLFSSFVIGVAALSVILAPMFNVARGNLFIVNQEGCQVF